MKKQKISPFEIWQKQQQFSKKNQMLNKLIDTFGLSKEEYQQFVKLIEQDDELKKSFDDLKKILKELKNIK